jgi:hypothetical protein
MTVDGLTTILSSFGPKETMDRFETEVKAKGLTVFARVDHAAGAAAVGMLLRPLIRDNSRSPLARHWAIARSAIADGPLV